MINTTVVPAAILAQADDTVGDIQDTAEKAAQALPGWAIPLIWAGATLVVALCLTWLARRLIRRWEIKLAGEDVDAGKGEEAKRAQTLGGVLRAGATAVIWFIAILVILGRVGMNIGPFIAAAGVGGVALGFGAQSLVRDLIGGFFILAEKQYDVGDVISIANVAGVVDKITLHSTVLRDLDGTRHVVPNGEVRVSSNFTKGFSRYLLDLPVPYEEDVDRVVDLVKDVTADMRREPQWAAHMLTGLEVLGVDDYAESQVTVKVYVDTTPGKQWQVGRELRRRIKRAYDDAGVSIPYAHREVILRTADGKGSGAEQVDARIVDADPDVAPHDSPTGGDRR